MSLVEKIPGMPKPRTAQASPFAKLKQSPAMEAIIDLHLALSEQAAEEAALAETLSDILTPTDAAATAAQITATGGIVQRIRNAVEKVKQNTAALRELRARAEDLGGMAEQGGKA
jgi:hypothetical protein